MLGIMANKGVNMDMIATLKAEQSALRTRLREIDELLEEYAKWEARVASVVGPHGGSQQVGPQATPSPEDAATERPVTPIAEFEKAVLEILATAESPRNRTDLLADIEAVGVVVGGSDARNTLSARLTRMPQITNLKGHGYWLKDRPYEPSGYFGADDLLTPRETESYSPQMGALPEEPSSTSEGNEKEFSELTAEIQEFLKERDEDLL